MERGAIRDRRFATQVKDYSGMRWGNITPTDIDGAVEFKGKCYVFIEAKYRDAPLPYGQQLALTRIIDDLQKPSILFVCSHECAEHEDIDMAKTTVERFYFRGRWYTLGKPHLLLDLTDRFLRRHGGK